MWTPATANGTTGTATPNAQLNGLRAINGFGQAIMNSGYSPLLFTPNTRNGSTGTILGIPGLAGATQHTVVAINEGGDVLGYSCVTQLSGSCQNHAFLWTPSTANGLSGTTVELPVPAGFTAVTPTAMNSNRTIVGTMTPALGNPVPFLYTGSTYYDLTTIAGLPLAATPVAINQAGQIVLNDQSGYQSTVYLATQLSATCTYSLSASDTEIGASGGFGTLTVATDPNCAWTVRSDSQWLRITSADSGTGSSTVSYAVDPNPNTSSRSGILTAAGQTVMVRQAGRVVTLRPDFNGDGIPDIVWQNDITRQVTVNYYGGASGASYQGWNWLNTNNNAGWHVVAAADFNGNGVPDLVWQYDSTRQVTVNYYGGTGGASYQGWTWLNTSNNTGWRVVAAADFNGDGVPDLVWQNDSTRQVTVNYYGGTAGASYQGWNWLNTNNNTGWHVVAAADFNGDGVPDLVWQNDNTRQVTVNYYGGTGGASYQGWNWLNTNNNAGWHVVAAADFNGDGVPDLVWQNDTTRQVAVNYYGGPGGATYQGWNWLNGATNTNWSLVNSSSVLMP